MADAALRFRRLPDGPRQDLVAAAREIEACQRVLARTGETLVARLSGAQHPPEAWLHYPDGGDVYDPVSHAQYYFHRHQEPDDAGEVGHFHTFLRPAGMSAGLQPERRPPGAVDDNAPSHLVAIAIDGAGAPVRLFTTNRWVTGEAWYAADDVEAMLDRFVVERQHPSWAINRWLSALFRLYRGEMGLLLHARDEAVRRWRASHPGVDALEDRGLETASTMRIDLAERLREVDRALGR